MDAMKIRFAERRHLHPPRIDHDDNFEQGKTLVPYEIGKVHFKESISTASHSSGKAKVFHPPTASDRPEGKRYIPVHVGSTEYSTQKRRHFDVAEAMYVEEPTTLPRLGWTRKATVMGDDSRAARDRVSDEYNLEADMNRKQRIRDLDRQRNGIGIATLGDRPFRQVEHETGFYSRGGLISGSTISLRKSAKPLMKSTLAMSSPNGKSTQSFEDKLKSKNIAYELNLIQALTNPGLKLGEPVPSWEERTGCFLVRPEDEPY